MLDEKMLEELVDRIAFDDTKKLLVDLAINFTKKTQIQVVPSRTNSWIVEIMEENTMPPRRIVIRLIPFFGMYVGYNSELDLLVIWKI